MIQSQTVWIYKLALYLMETSEYIHTDARTGTTAPWLGKYVVLSRGGIYWYKSTVTARSVSLTRGDFNAYRIFLNASYLGYYLQLCNVNYFYFFYENVNVSVNQLVSINKIQDVYIKYIISSSKNVSCYFFVASI